MFLIVSLLDCITIQDRDRNLLEYTRSNRKQRFCGFRIGGEGVPSQPFVPILGPSRSPLGDDTSLVLNASLPLVAGTPILLPLVLAATLVNTEIETSPDAAFPLDDDISSIPVDPEIETSLNDAFQLDNDAPVSSTVVSLVSVLANDVIDESRVGVDSSASAAFRPSCSPAEFPSVSSELPLASGVSSAWSPEVFRLFFGAEAEIRLRPYLLRGKTL